MYALFARDTPVIAVDHSQAGKCRRAHVRALHSCASVGPEDAFVADDIQDEMRIHDPWATSDEPPRCFIAPD